ncbi:MAG: ABC transporter ATP-binding protein [Candidatus Dormibacteraceae bacterium]
MDTRGGSSGACVVETHDLSKRYGARQAVDHLNLRVPQGTVFGFLGPNGAGKTTTIRMLLGLIPPTSGRIDLFGEDLAAARGRLLPRVGALIEEPALYRYLSGLANLQVFGAPLAVSDARLGEVLRTVDLWDRRRDRVRTFSLGMRQRLGVAVALLGDPDLLVLDEPANGLDPAGVVAMRDLLRGLTERGKTVFVSSHVLGEVQQLCERVAIVHQGRLVTEGSMAALLSGRGEFEIRVEDPAAALAVLHRTDWGSSARLEEGLIVTKSPTGEGRDLARHLAQAGISPDRIAERTHELESIFLSLTQEAAGTDPAAKEAVA